MQWYVITVFVCLMQNDCTTNQSARYMTKTTEQPIRALARYMNNMIKISKNKLGQLVKPVNGKRHKWL